jgi:hypothetical protein
MMYQVFHELRQGECEEVIKTAGHVEKTSTYLLVEERRKWVRHLLKSLWDLGGIEDDTVYWDDFLYILVQFCSLSKSELCQALFHIILKKQESKVQHYVTLQQLIDFYSYWGKCPVTSFNTRAIDFTRLPLRRYYVEDFTELVQRFTVLLNPTIHLQRSLQEFLPSAEFWDDYSRSEVGIRKITYEFFKMEKTRCHLYGEPPFRESCEMLAPEALGFEACNKDQWELRTFDLHERVGAISDVGGLSKDGKWMAPPGFQFRPLKQFSVWGEQPSPEETERMMLMDQEDVYISATGYITRHVRDDMTQDDPQEDQAATGDKDKKKEEEKKKKDKKKKDQSGLAIQQEELDLLNDPTSAALWGACRDETFDLPPADMPPAWMKGVAIAPAPRNYAPDPPLRVKDFDSTQSSFWQSQANLTLGRTQDTWGEGSPTSMRKGKNEGKAQGKSNMRGFNAVQFSDM